MTKQDGLAPADSLKCHIARLRNEQGNVWYATGASLLPLPFFKVTFTSLLTSESLGDVSQQHPDHLIIFYPYSVTFLGALDN